MRLRCVAYQWSVNPLHRWLITHAIRLHTGDLDASWDRLEQETAREITEALDIGKLSLPDYLRWRATVIFERLSLELGRTRFWRRLHAWRVRLTG
jgi:hypothetical protein